MQQQKLSLTYSTAYTTEFWMYQNSLNWFNKHVMTRYLKMYMTGNWYIFITDDFILLLCKEQIHPNVKITLASWSQEWISNNVT